MLLPVAQALKYAHELNIVHRDVKPSNILLSTTGLPQLSDFGLAKMLETEDNLNLTGTGMGIGTPGYMAPEQWLGEVVPQSDIYSLGVVLYEMVTGRKPYVADTPAAVLLKQNNEPLPRPSSFVADIPEGVENFLFKALAKEPDNRYADMGAFIKALERLEQLQERPKEISPGQQEADVVQPVSAPDESITRVGREVKKARSEYRRGLKTALTYVFIAICVLGAIVGALSIFNIINTEEGISTPDATAVPTQSTMYPFFSVHVNSDRVDGEYWDLGTEVTMTIDDDDNPGNGVLYEDTQTVGVYIFMNAEETIVSFSLPDAFDIQTGHIVTLTDGSTTRTHTVLNIEVTSVDPETDQVQGRANPGVEIRVANYHVTGYDISVTADDTGHWMADFSGFYDLVPGTEGCAELTDTDGDNTRYDWSIPTSTGEITTPSIAANPNFDVFVNTDWVEGHWWALGTEVTMVIDNDEHPGNGILYRDTQPVGNAPWSTYETTIAFQLPDFDIQSGHIVTLTDGISTITHTVHNVEVASVDAGTDQVQGTADPGAEVQVSIFHVCCYELIATADSTGHWVVDFSGLFDLVPGTQIGTSMKDSDGNGTIFEWVIPTSTGEITAPASTMANDPFMSVFVNTEWVEGERWALGTDVTMTIDNDNDPGNGVLYQDTQTVGIAPWNSEETQVEFHLPNFDVQTGHVVTLTDGITTISHTVLYLEVTSVDVGTDQVQGTADPGAEVLVSIFQVRHYELWATADDSGQWVVDFSELYDLVPGTEIGSRLNDAEGNGTGFGWTIPSNP
jgi:hypothetical protein